ncbi:MAG: CoA transferase, partial [Actinomycetota bacterium]|nr:CoA transferase [Actinomycetota bacterium]
RRERQGEIEATLGRWTAEHDQVEVVEQLSAPGLAVAIVADAQQVLDDEQLAATDAWTTTSHPAAGPETWPRTPITFDGDVLSPRRPAPMLGEHNRLLLDETALDDEHYQRLIDSDALAVRPPD